MNALFSAAAEPVTFPILQDLSRQPQFDLNAFNRDSGLFLIHWTALQNNPVALKWLLDQPSVDVNRRSESDHNVLFYTHTEAARIVVADPRVDVNIANVLGAPLDMAAGKSLENVRALMQSGKLKMTPQQREAIAKQKSDWGIAEVNLFSETK